VGEGANIGAGTITCNYDGFTKAHTDIGAGAFVGSNTALVAPVTVGARAVVGAGSVITRDVEDDALAVARAEQSNHEGGAARLKEHRAAKPGKRAAGKKG
jgi:bifunctional UDP-N-acetylglucosamine pyrophosphorylase/glucosamine-1-phosphate N-acetyltransferase